ncbi:MAG: aromatic ring-hydroxylating dioxygenase subunit alpha, partial [Candidatus Dormibacteraeota bacterium]|nr:aromatic ring-hydroxylating dioxygenase subunit alpha [Candidatus Dormibacteraeota bacterium]
PDRIPFLHDEAVTPSSEAVEAFNTGMSGFWHPVAMSSELSSDRPLGVELLGQRLALARLDNRICAFDDLCRHFGAALSIGAIVDGCLRCAYHGWTYDAAGRVVDIPARRGLPIPREARVTSYAALEAYGLIWVCLAGEPRADLPAYPEFADASFRRTGYRSYDGWEAAATRIVMAALDDTHFPWVHPGILGDPSQPEPPDHQAWVEGDHLVATYTVDQPANISLGSAEGAGGRESVTYTNNCYPSTIRLRKEAPGGVFVLFQTMQPIAFNRTRIFLQVARNFDLDPARDESYLAFEDVIQSQDRPVVESQRPWLLPPLSSRLMLYVRPADLPLIAYQRWMEDLGIPQI